MGAQRRDRAKTETDKKCEGHTALQRLAEGDRATIAARERERERERAGRPVHFVSLSPLWRGVGESQAECNALFKDLKRLLE